MGRKKSSDKVNDLYLIPKFENREFEYPSLISISKEVIDHLVETKELKYLTNLLTIESIYKEDIFWKQIKHWKLLEYIYREEDNAEALKDIEKIQASLCNGFKHAIKSYKPNKQGRPSKPVNLDDDTDIVKKYITLEKQIRNEIATPDMEHNFRVNGLTEYLNKHSILGTKINISKNKISALAKKSSSDIAISLLSEALGVGTRKIKKLIADTDNAEEGALIFELPDGNKRRVSYEVFDKSRLEIFKEAKKKHQDLSKKDLLKKLSRKLKIPEKSIAKCFESGVDFDLFYKSNLPHKKR